MSSDNEEVLDFIAMQLSELIELQQQNAEMRAALEAFVEAWEKSHQLEKTDVAFRMAQQALAQVKED